MKTLMVFIFIIPMFFQSCVVVPVSIKRGDEYFSKKEYLNAIQSYEMGLPQVKNQKLRQSINDKMVLIKAHLPYQYISKSERIYNSHQPVTVLVIDEAMKILKSGLKWDDNSGRIAHKLKMYKQEKDLIVKTNQEKYQEAIREAKRYNYSHAEELLDQALALNPLNNDFKRAKEKIMGQNKHYKNIEKYIKAGDIQNVRKSFDLFTVAIEKNMPFFDFPLKEPFVKLILQKAADFTKNNRWYEAHNFLLDLNFDAIQRELSNIKPKGSAYYYKLAKSSVEKQNNYYKGYIYSLMANELNPSDFEIFNINKKTQDYIDKSIQKNIAVASFDSPSNDPDAGKQFSDSLISYLYQVLPYGINILERDKIDFVLKEQKTETKSAGKMLNVDLIVTGTVSLYKVDELVDERIATVKVKVGDETIENPEFSQMATRYGTNQSKWPKIPPRTIQKAKYQLLNYKKGTAQLKGFAKVSIRIFDTEKGTITFVKDFDASRVNSSEFQDEVKGANIRYIPKKLPSNTEIKESMRKGIIAKIARIVQAAFENREIRFLNEANFFIERKEYESALEPLAQGYFYCIKDNLGLKNKTFLQISNMINDISGRDSLIPK